MGLASLLRFGLIIALRRTAADWRLQTAAAFGTVLAVALMATAVIYSNSLRETALDHTLDTATQRESNLVTGVSHPLETPVFQDTNQFIRQRILSPLNPYLEEAELFIRTATFFFTGHPQLDVPDDQRPRGPVQGVTRLDQNARVVKGRLPRLAIDELEVVIDPKGESLLGLSVGQEFGIYPAVLGGPGPRVLTARIVGIIEPEDPDGRYWQLGFPKRYSTLSDDVATVPLYADPNVMFETLGATFSGLSSDFYWLLFLDHDGLQASEVNSLRDTLRRARADFFNVHRATGTWDTKLSDLLDRYASLLTLARIPLFLLVFLAIGVLFYYLFLIAGLMGRTRAPEVALFRSRGASLPQVGLVILTEGLILALPAIVLGPFLAQALVIGTGAVFPAATGGAQLLIVDLSPSVFLMGMAAGLVAVLVLSATTLGTARHGIVEFRRAGARPPQMPFLHRYYVDIALLALIGMVWWQFQSRGSFLIRPLQGAELQLDLTLLLGPVLGIVAVGLVLFRLFPLLMRVVSWPAEPVVPVWLAQGLRRIARDPVPAGALLVLLALATSLGVMAATFTTTLERNQRERALYEAGADFRLVHTLGQAGLAGEGLAGAMRSVPGVVEATDVVRVGPNIIGVDPDTFAQVAWTRPDFASRPLAGLLQELRPPDAEPSGLELPAGVTHLRVWVQTGPLRDSLDLFARLQDSQGLYFDTKIGELGGTGWRMLEAPIAPRSIGFRTLTRSVDPVPPYRLLTLWMDAFGTGAENGVVFFDQLEAISPSGTTELASFQTLEQWHPLGDALIPGLYALELSESVARPGRKSAAFSWPGLGARLRGIRVGPAEAPLPVLVSPSFLPANQVEIGDTLTIQTGVEFIRARVVGTAEFIPTLDPREEPFVVIDSDSFVEYVLLRAPRGFSPRVESWVRADGETLTATTLRQVVQDQGGRVNETYDAAEMVASRNQDPLLVAGWAGLLALSFVTVVLASASGLILYTYIDARERSEEFALLRTLGFSRLQVNGLLWFNLTLIVGLGILIGTWGGQLLGRTLLPLLEIAEQGTRVVPSMVLQTNWVALGAAYGVLGVATIITVVVLAWAISRLEIQRLLRSGAG